MRNLVILIGVNKYEFKDTLKPLQYAVHDAEALYDFFTQEIKVAPSDVFLLTDSFSRLAHIRNELKNLKNTFKLCKGDRLWFFFSGHGIRSNDGKYYLMPLDGNPDDIEHTGLWVEDVITWLCNCNNPTYGDPDVLLFLDACRANAFTGEKSASENELGQYSEQWAATYSIEVFSSCARYQKSYECESIRHGIFTYALLRAWRGLPRQNTVDNLAKFLSYTVPELCKQYNLPPQNPVLSIEPYEKAASIVLFNQFAEESDILPLRYKALQLNVQGKMQEALDAWDRVRELKPKDEEATRMIKELSKDIIESRLNPRYVNLRNFLAAGQWEKADEETWKVMCSALGKKILVTSQPLAMLTPGFKYSDITLSVMDIEKFPYQILREIDDLWVEHSKGRFGFSVQKRIYEKVNQDQRSFGDEIEWRKNNNWIFYSDVIFDISAPEGHLPIGGPRGMVFLPYEEIWENQLTIEDMLKAGKAYFAGDYNVLWSYLHRREVQQGNYALESFGIKEYSQELCRSVYSTTFYSFKEGNLGRFFNAAFMDLTTPFKVGHRLALYWLLGRILLMERL